MTNPHQLTQKAETTFRYYINRKKPYPYFEGHLQKYRCPHIKQNGQRCNRQSVIGYEECRQHLKMDKHLTIKKSKIPKAGLGVFTTNGSNNGDVVFPAEDKICDYNGEDISAHTLYERYLQNTAPYALEVKNNLYIDGALARGIGSMINASNSQDDANVKFVKVTGNKVEIHAKKDIKNGDELIAWYGSSYRLTGEPIHHSTRLYSNKKENKRNSTTSAVVSQTKTFTIKKGEDIDKKKTESHSTTSAVVATTKSTTNNKKIKVTSPVTTNTPPLLSKKKQENLDDFADELITKEKLEELLSKNIPLDEIRKLFNKDKNGKSKLTPTKRLKKIDELVANYKPAPPTPPPPPPKSKQAIEQENYFKDILLAGVTKREINDLLATGIRRDYIRHFLSTRLVLRQKNRATYKKEFEEFKVGRFNPNYKPPEEHYYKELIKQGVTMEEIKELLDRKIDKAYVKAFFENNMKLFKNNKNAFEKKKELFIKDFTVLH